MNKSNVTPQLMEEREIERLSNEIEVLRAKVKAINERDFIVVKDRDSCLYLPTSFQIQQYIGYHWTTVAFLYDEKDIQPVLNALKAVRGMTA